jgi:hypothetical protein
MVQRREKVMTQELTGAHFEKGPPGQYFDGEVRGRKLRSAAPSRRYPEGVKS